MTGRQAVAGRHTGADDAVLLELVAGGDRDALGALYRRHARVVLAQIRLVVGEPGLSEEILQDTMLAVWRGAGSFRGVSQVRSWIIAIALRQARDRLRRRQLAVVADESVLSGQAAADPGPEAQVLDRAELAAVAGAIRSLSPAHREVLGLVFGADLTLADAAEALGVPVGAGLGLSTVLAPGGGTGPGGAGRPAAATAVLTSTSCARLKLVIGTLASVSGSTLVIKPVIGPAVRVTTSASTKVAREVTGTLADVRDGMHVIVSGSRSHGQIAARRIGVTSSSLGMRAPLLPVQGPPAALILGVANGTVADAAAGGFTVHEPGGTQVRVTTSGSTKVVLLARVTAAQLRTGQPTVAVGSVTGRRELAASTVEQENLPLSQLRPAQWYHPLPLPAGFSPVRPGSFPRLRPGGWPWPVRRGFPWPAGLPALLPGPGALFSGLGCNAPAIAVTGLLAFGG